MIIFVAGIHGVGKTFLGQFAAENLKVQHATASQLIREERGRQSWSFEKRVRDVNNNQVALVSAVRRFQAAGTPLLLDGHFVLRDEFGGTMEIEESIFRAIGVDAVLLLEDRIEVIVERLRARGDTSWSTEDLRHFADKERSHAAKVSKSLALPLMVLRSPDCGAFMDALGIILSAA